MGVHSGKFGVIENVSTIRNWTVTDDITNPKYVASNTLGGTARQTGVQSWSGSFNTYGALPPVMPGFIFPFLGYTAPGDDVEGSNGQRGTGSAIVDNVVITWNWATGDIISIVTNFSGHLGIVWADGAAIVDDSVPVAPPVCPTKIETSPDGVAFTPLPNCTQAILTISAANVSYVNSSTNCWTGKKAGPIDWTLAVTREDDLFMLTKGSNHIFKVYTSAAEFYLLKWGMVKGFTGLTVNEETGEIIKHVLNAEMNGFVGGIAGQIAMPGGAVYWPGGTLLLLDESAPESAPPEDVALVVEE